MPVDLLTKALGATMTHIPSQLLAENRMMECIRLEFACYDANGTAGMIDFSGAGLPARHCGSSCQESESGSPSPLSPPSSKNMYLVLMIKLISEALERLA